MFNVKSGGTWSYHRALKGGRSIEWVLGLDCSGSGYGLTTGSCERGNVPSSFVKRVEFLDHLNNY